MFSDPKLSWYVVRSAGFVAWLMCAAAVGWGLTLSSRLVHKKGAPAWLLASHRFLGLLSVIFVLIHMAGLWFDHYQPFRVADLLVPFHTSWKPLAIAWGIVAFYLLLAVELTSIFMRRIPKKWWHRIHMSSFALLVLATVHVLTAGTDRANALVRWSGLVVSVVLIFVATFRLLSDRKAQRGDRSAALGAARAQAAQAASSAPSALSESTEATVSPTAPGADPV